MTTRQLIIFGVGNIAQVAYHHFTYDSKYEVIAFAVDAQYLHEVVEYKGLPVVDFASIEEIYPPSCHELFVAMGYHELNQVRAEKYNQGKKKGYKLASYVHSSNHLINREQVGENSFVMAGESLQPESIVKDNSFIWTNACIGHHSKIGSHCWITSGAVIGGNSDIGDYSFIGLNATIGHRVSIGAKNFIGACAFITQDTEDKAVYIQAQTKPYRLNSEQFIRLAHM